MESECDSDEDYDEEDYASDEPWEEQVGIIEERDDGTNRPSRRGSLFPLYGESKTAKEMMKLYGYQMYCSGCSKTDF